MTIRRTLLRGAALLALSAAIIGSTTIAPAAAASALASQTTVYGVQEKKNGAAVTDDNDNYAYHGTNDNDTNDNEASDDEGGGISDVPIIGDVVGGFQDAPPEQIVTGAIEFAGFAAETVVPLIINLVK